MTSLYVSPFFTVNVELIETSKKFLLVAEFIIENAEKDEHQNNCSTIVSLFYLSLGCRKKQKSEILLVGGDQAHREKKLKPTKRENGETETYGIVSCQLIAVYQAY